MEEHTLQPGAEEQKKPQIETTDHSEEALTQEHQTPDESPAEETENVEKPTSQEKAGSASSEKVVSKNSDEDPEIIPTVKEVDYTVLSIDELIDAYENLSGGEHWLKEHKTLQTINTLFENRW